MEYKLKYKLTLLAIFLLIGCNSNKNKTYQCFTKNKKELFNKLQVNFENQLEAKFNKGHYKLNLLSYLEQFQNNEEIKIIKPPVELQLKIKSQEIISDIWQNRSINQNSEFIKCLRTSEQHTTKEYLDRILDVGDMSPSIISNGAIELINGENEIDKELELILLVNFYLIWINEN